jgi:hypothetical protein
MFRKDESMGNYESPEYDVLKKDGPFEIRKYHEFDTVTVIESKLSGYSGFGLLFSYISGNNQNQTKMSMTIPVINEFEDDGMTMEFVVPKAYQNDSIPIPNHEHLRIKHYDEHIVCSITFKGTTSQKKIDKQLLKLKEWMKNEQVVERGRYRLARYNPPFSLPSFRRNEILIEIGYQEN